MKPDINKDDWTPQEDGIGLAREPERHRARETETSRQGGGEGEENDVERREKRIM